MSRILVERRNTGASLFDAMDVLGPVAKWIHEHRPTGMISRSELLALVRRSLRRLTGDSFASGSDERAAEQFCADAEQQFGILVERGFDLIGFQHRMFQEYFTAVEITSQSEDVFADIASRVDDPYWREVILLAVGREAFASASRCRHLLLRLLDLGVRDRPSRLFDDVPRISLIVADSLAEVARAMPDVEIAVLERLVRYHCSAADPHLGAAATEVHSRILEGAARSPTLFDAVCSRALLSTDYADRKRLCELVSNMTFSMPQTFATLEALDSHRGVGLAERACRQHLSESASMTADSELPSDDALIIGALKHLEAYGSSKAHVLVRGEAMHTNSGGREVVRQTVREGLLAIVNENHGVEAILAASALLILGPGLFGTLVDSLSSRTLVEEVADLTAWAVEHRQLPMGKVPGWESLDAEYRRFILLSAVTAGHARNAEALAWAEIGEAFHRRGDGADGDSHWDVSAALVVLTRLSSVSVTTARLRQLDWIATNSLVLRPAIEELLASGGASSETFDEGDFTSPAVLRLRDTVALEHPTGQLDPEVLERSLVVWAEPRGLWRPRVEQAWMRRSSASEIGWAAIERALVVSDAASESTDPGSIVVTNSTARFLALIEMDSPVIARAVLDRGGYLLRHPFYRAAEDVWAMIKELATEKSDRDCVVSARAVILSQVVRIVSTQRDSTSPDVGLARFLSSSTRWQDRRFLGASLAAAISAGVEIDNEALLAASSSRDSFLELCFWLGAAGPETVERSGVEHVDWDDRLRRSGASDADVLACGLRLYATSADNGLAWLGARSVDDSAVSRALLIAGEHEAPWFSRGQRTMRSACHDGISALGVTLAQDPAQLRSLLALIGTEIRLAETDWARVRFALDLLSRLGEAMPDAYRQGATAFALDKALAIQLHNLHSFGVRVRGFHCCALLGLMSVAMVDALCEASTDLSFVTESVFSAMNVVQSVESGSVQRLTDAMITGGLPGLGALDVVRVLIASEAARDSKVLREELAQSLVSAYNGVSAFEVCRLSSGAFMRPKALLLRTLAAIGGEHDRPLSDVQPHLLFRPSGDQQVGHSRIPLTGLPFEDEFLKRVRYHLRASAAGSV